MLSQGFKFSIGYIGPTFGPGNRAGWDISPAMFHEALFSNAVRTPHSPQMENIVELEMCFDRCQHCMH